MLHLELKEMPRFYGIETALQCFIISVWLCSQSLFLLKEMPRFYGIETFVSTFGLAMVISPILKEMPRFYGIETKCSNEKARWRSNN